MAEGERDDTNDWVLPAEARPATLAQLEERIDYAVALARASEAAALEIGAAALDAAGQARRAAELAERASRRVAPAATGEGEADGKAPPATPPETALETEYDRFKSFLERADRVSERLQAIAPGVDALSP